MKYLHKVLKIASWMYMTDFPNNILGCWMGAPKSLSLQSLKSKGLPIKDILCYPKGVARYVTLLG